MTKRKVLVMATGVKDYSSAEEFGDLKFVSVGSTDLTAVGRHMSDILKVMVKMKHDGESMPYIAVSGHHLLSGLMMYASIKVWGKCEALIFDSKTRTYTPTLISEEDVEKMLNVMEEEIK
jgi:hypothetical protein